jgi:hypothetical protein
VIQAQPQYCDKGEQQYPGVEHCAGKHRHVTSGCAKAGPNPNPKQEQEQEQEQLDYPEMIQ